MKINIKFEIDIGAGALEHYNDHYLATLWHIAQANPADPFENKEAGEFAERVGREIIRRFVSQTGPELWHHQGGHYNWGKLALHRDKDTAAIVRGPASGETPQ